MKVLALKEKNLDKEKIEHCINLIGLILYEGQRCIDEFDNSRAGYGLLKHGLKRLREELNK